MDGTIETDSGQPGLVSFFVGVVQYQSNAAVIDQPLTLGTASVEMQ